MPMVVRGQPPVPLAPGPGSDSDIAVAVKSLLAEGRDAAAREQYAELVRSHQRRALRIAHWYLRDVAEADEAVQDAFIKTFTHLGDFDETRSFDVWFTRILVNGCLDRLKARTRRERWMVPMTETARVAVMVHTAAREASPEALLLRRERGARLLDAVQRLPDRQRTVIMLSQIEGYSTREVGEVTGLSEATIRVHLFRALRRLRRLLADDPAFANGRHAAEPARPDRLRPGRVPSGPDEPVLASGPSLAGRGGESAEARSAKAEGRALQTTEANST
ncbi:MAG: sigma-70 family RNA polymerase sigma factor [Luteitalea sp.]|nr:sigma-70 family RNA polymerase sigma factor [Luteitalea sp.]